MSPIKVAFVHVFLFECPVCTSPMAASLGSSERNPEEADARAFALRCDCGWNGSQMGMLAKRHWVEGWS